MLALDKCIKMMNICAQFIRPQFVVEIGKGDGAGRRIQVAALISNDEYNFDLMM